MKAGKWIAAVLSAAMVLAMGTGAMAATVVEKPTVSVSASAEVEAEPDIAYLSLGVRTENKKSDKARSENTALMNKVIAAVKAQGIDEKDIKTSNLNLYANYSWSNDKRTLTGYTCNNTLTITVRDVTKVASVVDAAMEAGANNFNNVRFDLSDSEEYYIQAAALATKKAMRRAKGVAEAAGMTLGRAASLSTNGSNYKPIYEYADEEEVAEGAVADSAASVTTSIGGTIQSGKITISATVSAVFFLGE